MARELGLGRLQAPEDARNRDYLIPMMLPQLGAAKPRKTAYKEGPRLDQGAKPHCVAFSGLGFLNAAPLMRNDGYDTTKVYQECQRNDEWPGENYDGTSVAALMKVMETRGHIKGYVWGQSAKDAGMWTTAGHGTVIVGTDWYPIFDEIPRDGYMPMPPKLSYPIGGHAYRLNWFDPKKGAFLVVNSWDAHWGMPTKAGLTGTAYMKADVLQFLLDSGGEIAAPTQCKLQPVKL